MSLLLMLMFRRKLWRILIEGNESDTTQHNDGATQDPTVGSSEEAAAPGVEMIQANSGFVVLKSASRLL